MKKYPYFISLTLLILFVLKVNLFTQQIIVKQSFENQDSRDKVKIEKLGVSIKSVYSTISGAPNSTQKVEEWKFNKKGDLVEMIFFSYADTTKRIDFKYNPKGVVSEKITYGPNNIVLEKEITKFNKKGDPIEFYGEARNKRNKINKVRKILKYDKNGSLTEASIFGNDNKLIGKEKYKYDKDRMLYLKSYTPQGQIINSEEYEYNAEGKKVKERTVDYFYAEVADSTGKKVPKMTESDAVFTYNYDNNGKLKEILAPQYRQEFTYNENGDCLTDFVYEKSGKKTFDNRFEYYDNGLTQKVTRYYPDGTPIIFVEYKYEFYKK